MSVLRVSRPDVVAEVYAEYRSWSEIRFALFSVFKSFADAGRMIALYGNREAKDDSGYR